ncbi:hypothetical protein HYT56_04160 [Candidatus Woesearchaeota archaeon]|nr:hypothetical protein [Candidatus Woesearchaeota archaeon]
MTYNQRTTTNLLDYSLSPEINLFLMGRLNRNTKVRIHRLNELAQETPCEVLADQLLVADRIISLIARGIRSSLEDLATKFYESFVSGGSRHSFCIMGAYNKNPLVDYSLGKFDGGDFLDGSEIDLFGDNKTARETLRRIRTEEGVGLLKINDGDYRIINSGVLLFPLKLNQRNIILLRKEA